MKVTKPSAEKCDCSNCDGYRPYFPPLKGYKCPCQCHKNKTVKPLPNQEPVERELPLDAIYRIQQEFIKKLEDVTWGSAAFDMLLSEQRGQISKVIAHQKALSRAEVLEEVRKDIADTIKTVYSEAEADGDLHPGTIRRIEHLLSLSDTLAVVDEIKNKEGV